MKNKIIIPTTIAFITILILKCIQQPDASDNFPPLNVKHGVLILCEGMWGSDNSLLSRYDLDSSKYIKDFYSQSNPGMRLGDIANDMALYGDTLFIAITTSKTIEAIRVSTGKTISRIILDGYRAPRQICIVNDSTAYCTDLYNHSLIKFNPKKIELIKDNIPTGPAPEGIAYYNNYVFVANSGYGDYLKDKPKAGTISVIDIAKDAEISSLKNMPNVLELIVNSKKGLLYAFYEQPPSNSDTIGGIVEFDAASLVELRRWRLDGRSIMLSSTGDTLFFIYNENICFFNLLNKNPEPEQLIINPNLKEHWNCLAISPYDGSFWIGNAKNFQIEGEVIVFPTNSLTKHSYVLSTGVIPNKILFF